MEDRSIFNGGFMMIIITCLVSRNNDKKNPKGVPRRLLGIPSANSSATEPANGKR